MAFPASVEKLDAIPEALRDPYKQDGSRYVLGVTGAERVFAALDLEQAAAARAAAA